MDQTELKNQILHRHQKECSHDADLDCFVRLSAASLSQVYVEVKEKYAANSALIATQFV
jgi:hypothetical protein